MDFVGDDRQSFSSSSVFSLSSLLFLLSITHPSSLSLSPLPLPNLYTLQLSLYPLRLSSPLPKKKFQKDASAAVRKACSSSRSSGNGGGGGIRQELMLKSLSSKLKQKAKKQEV